MSYAFDEIRISEEPGGTVVTLIFKPFTRAEVRYSDMAELERAKEWISRK